jgi:hypothetical protein
MRAKTVLTVIILILVAFGVGYFLGYWKLHLAEKKWASAQGEMQSRINSLEKQLALARAREKLYEIPEMLAEAGTHLAEKNFGLAERTLDGVKEAFGAAQPSLGGEVKGRFDPFLAALEEAKKEAQSLSPNAQGKVEEVRKLFEQALRPATGQKGGIIMERREEK